MRRRKTLLAALAAATLLPALAQGAGYSIYEQGAAVLGMAGAGTASVHDASALFFNPAAMTRLEGTQLYLGGTMLSPRISFAGESPLPGYGVTEEMVAQDFYPPTVYFTHRYGNQWALGIGLDSPFGLGVEWKQPKQFSGRGIVTKADLQALNGIINVAWTVTPQLSLGGGGDLMYAKVKLDRVARIQAPGGGGALLDVANVDLKSDFSPGYGWNAGVSWVPTSLWKLGASYRSKVIVDVDGDAAFQQIHYDRLTDSLVAAKLPPDQPVKTVLRFPAIWSVGVAFTPGAWTLEADFNWTEWAVFTDLPIAFQTTPASSKAVVEDYDSQYQVRAGVEHRTPGFAYRLGYYFDKAAAPARSVSPLLPDADRSGAAVGLGFGFGAQKRLTLDLYELALFVQQRSTEHVNHDNYNGEYKSFVNMAGFSLAYRW